MQAGETGSHGPVRGRDCVLQLQEGLEGGSAPSITVHPSPCSDAPLPHIEWFWPALELRLQGGDGHSPSSDVNGRLAEQPQSR